MRILRYTYSKILNLFLRRFDSLISIADCTASKLYDVELTICATKTHISTIQIKSLYYSMQSKQMVLRCSVNGIMITKTLEKRQILNQATFEAKIKNRKTFQFTISIPDIGTMHLQRTNQELFFKTFLSAADIISLLPEQMPNRHEIAESMPNGLKVLAYYNGNIQSVHPKISYATEGFYRKKSVTDFGPLLKGCILQALEKQHHFSKSNIRYEDIPLLVKSAVICTEDPAYMLHKGVCPYALGLIVQSLMCGRLPHGGGSTITQQLMRNAFFPSELSIHRKIKEIVTSLIAENVYNLSKHDILETYLNMTEMGRDVFGVADASFHYFGKPISQLTEIEVLTLTYVLPRPIFFEEALIKKTEQLKTNLKAHILRFLPTLVNKKVISHIHETFPIRGIRFQPSFGFLPFTTPKPLHHVKYIIVHCSATAFGFDAGTETLRLIHLQRGFDDVGYHWIIKINGDIEAGRSENLQGAHCEGHNHHSIGVCYVGGLDADGQPANTLTANQDVALVALCKNLKKKYPMAKIVGHSQIANKCCPCFNVEKWKKLHNL